MFSPVRELVHAKVQEPVLPSLCTRLVRLLVFSPPVPAHMAPFLHHVPHLALPSSRDRSPCRHVHEWLNHLHQDCSHRHLHWCQKKSLLADSFSVLVSPSWPVPLSYAIEIAPPRRRGGFTAFYNCESIPSIVLWITLTCRTSWLVQ